MQPQGGLIPNKGNEIQYFWKLLYTKEDELKKYEPQLRFARLYTDLSLFSGYLNGDSKVYKYLRGDSNAIRIAFVHNMLKSIVSSLCYEAPLPIIIYSSNTRFYEFRVIREIDKNIELIMFEYKLEDSKALLSNVYLIIKCRDSVHPILTRDVMRWTGLRYASELYIEIPGVYKKVGVKFNDDKIEIRKIGEGE